MKKVTITLDEKTAAWVRVYAARHNMSVSRVVGEMLRDHMRDRSKYEQAMRRFLAKPAFRFKPVGGRITAREALHDRPALR